MVRRRFSASLAISAFCLLAFPTVLLAATCAEVAALKYTDKDVTGGPLCVKQADTCDPGSYEVQISDTCTAPEKCCIEMVPKNGPGTCAQVIATKFSGQMIKGDPLCVKSAETCPNGMSEVQDSTTCPAPLEKCCAELQPNGQLGSVSSTKVSPGSPTTLTDPLNLGGKGLTEVLRRVIQAFLGLVGAIALLVFVVAGFTYMTSSNEKSISHAKAMMANAMIGIVIIMSAYTIANLFFMALTK